jgi:hypothetical protein
MNPDNGCVQRQEEAIVLDPWDPNRTMRWLMIALLVSLAALLVASAGVAHHVWQEHKRRKTAPARVERNPDTEEAP